MRDFSAQQRLFSALRRPFPGVHPRIIRSIYVRIGSVIRIYEAGRIGSAGGERPIALENRQIGAYVLGRNDIEYRMSLAKFFGRSTGPSGPKRRRAYVIGDIHGCLDLLDRLLERIEEEIAAAPRMKTSIIFLGDIVDRGPSSAQVVERLRTYSNPQASAHFIMGNHEEVMLRVIAGDTDMLGSWLRFGGRETLASYGVDSKSLKKLESTELSERLRSAIPESHRRFLAGFSDSISFGDYVFVHAGIRPGVDLAEQSQSDLRWIREPFLSDETERGFIVVHGHTITNSVDVAPNRIGVDTGAYSTGILSALAIEQSRRWLVQTNGEETQRVSLEERP